MRGIVLLLVTIAVSGAAFAEPPDARDEQGRDVLAGYFKATEAQRDALRGATMDVLMDAKLPKMKKEGRLSALRSISNLGKITYKVVSAWGDDTVKREVIARFMTAETQAKESSAGQVAINEQNYKFKYKGERQIAEESRVHVFELKPRHKRVGLFKGELWIDPGTYLPVREQGQLVKNPSIFIKKMEFVRDFQIQDGVAIPKRFEGKTDTRVAGKAELTIEYANVQRQPAADQVASESWAQAPPQH